MVLAAVGQLCSTANVAHNTRLCSSIIRRAASAGAQLVYLPEASDFIADKKDVPRLAQPLQGGAFVEAMRESARAGKIWVGVGVHEQGTEDKCYNTNLLISPDGNIAQAYRKLHLFDVKHSDSAVLMESNTTIKGEELHDPTPTPIGKVGLLTCYDLRFPEVSLSLRRRGAEIITYPSAFTTRTGPPHWEVLLRARAIETQCYVLAPAQIGQHAPGRNSWGHAMIVSPWGDVLAQAPDRLPRSPPSEADEDAGDFVVAEVELDWLEQIRRDMPLWEQRRGDVYPTL
ncbi:hypothetical protein JCM10207_007698 [Rhodosporidiobolus poonsookiae]